MNPMVKNILAVLAGIVVGMIINGGIVQISGSIIPPPEGADVSTFEGLKASMHLFEPKNFLMPFLAHALGTLVGAAVTAKLAASQKMIFALAIGAFFLLGGITMAMKLPSPTWFLILDIGVAYIPMGYLAGRLMTRGK